MNSKVDRNKMTPPVYSDDGDGDNENDSNSDNKFNRDLLGLSGEELENFATDLKAVQRF